jgi:hypothetical protein
VCARTHAGAHPRARARARTRPRVYICVVHVRVPEGAGVHTPMPVHAHTHRSVAQPAARARLLYRVKARNLEQRLQFVYSVYFVFAKPHRPGCSPAPRQSTPRPPPPPPPASRTRIRPCRQSKSSILPSPLSLILALLLPLLVPCPLPTSVVNLIHSANQCARARACVICFLVFPPG